MKKQFIFILILGLAGSIWFARANRSVPRAVQTRELASIKATEKKKVVSPEVLKTPLQVWSPAEKTTGQPLGPDAIEKSQAAHKKPRHQHTVSNTKGRQGYVTLTDIQSLREIGKDQVIELPLFDGAKISGRVNLAMEDVGGWTRIGGHLADESEGSFSLHTNGTEFSGRILLKKAGVAVLLTREPNGKIKIEEKPLGDVLCSAAPAAPPALAALLAAARLRPAAAADPVPQLSSRPTATNVLYIDFDGETVVDPDWNGGNPITVSGFNFDTNTMTKIWEAVAEDYAPFNIDVTTNLSRYTGAGPRQRIRVIVTPDRSWYGGAGGVAYIGSFTTAGLAQSSTIPAWTFEGHIKYSGEITSHEAGHTLTLLHDGTRHASDGSVAQYYYAGHGTGATSWAPIMGTSYYMSISQWSKGDYTRQNGQFEANNQQDDIAIMGGLLGFVTDEAGGTTATSASLSVNSGNINQAGFISRESDIDIYRFTTGSDGALNLAARPAPHAPNMDMLVEILNSSGAVIGSDNPLEAQHADLNIMLSAGTYYIRVQGTGKATWETNGYTSYGSLGKYSLTGTVGGTVTPPTPNPLPPTITSITERTVYAGVQTSAVGFTVGDPDTNLNSLTVSASSSNTSLIPNSSFVFQGSGANRAFQFTPTAGQTGSATVTVTVSDGSLSASTSFVVTVTIPNSAPVFTSNPVSLTRTIGQSASFSANATGTPMPTYQWYKNGSAINGATGSTHTISSVTLDDAGSYTVTATNSVSSVTSSAATLTVQATAPAFSTQPTSQTRAVGQNVSFTVGVTGNPTPTLQWYKNGGAISGATSTTYSIGAVTANDAGNYTVVATNSANSVSSSTAVLTVQTAPAFTSQPLSQARMVGQGVSFSVSVTGNPAPTVQWYKNGNAISGATSTTYSIGSVVLGDAGNYTAVATNSVSSVTSSAAALTISPVPVPTLLSGTVIGTSSARTCSSGTTDSDSDGLTDCDEKVLGTNPNNWDTDQDGLSDRLALLSGQNPTDGAAGAQSPLGDGVTNAAKVKMGLPIHAHFSGATQAAAYDYAIVALPPVGGARCFDFHFENVPVAHVAGGNRVQFHISTVRQGASRLETVHVRVPANAVVETPIVFDYQSVK